MIFRDSKKPKRERYRVWRDCRIWFPLWLTNQDDEEHKLFVWLIEGKKWIQQENDGGHEPRSWDLRIYKFDRTPGIDWA